MQAEIRKKAVNRFNSLSFKWEVILNAIFIIYSLFCIGPLLLIAGISLSDEGSLLKYGYNFIPRSFSLAAYDYVAKNALSIVRAYGVTIFVSVVGTVLSVLIIAFFAYPLSRKDVKYKKHFTFFMFITIIFNAGMVPWYLVCTKMLNLQNTIWALIIPYLFNAWYVIILRTFFVINIPDAVVESARIDGAGELRTFFRIVLPLSLPGVATIALFQTLGYWNDWWLPLMLTTKPELSNLQFLLYRILANIQALADNTALSSNLSVSEARLPTESTRMALCIIAIGPIILAYPFFQRYFIRGLTVGAVKG